MRPVYRLYIDESGDHTYGRKESKPLHIIDGDITYETAGVDHYPQLEKIDKRYLGLTGCILKLDYYRDEFGPTMDSFKRDFFDPDERVVLHAKDIIQKKGVFHILQNEEVHERFNAGLVDIIANAQYAVINVVIDKKKHVERYIEAWHPYHYCLANMLMRYCFYLARHRAKGDVMAESRGAIEDMALKTAYTRLYSNGTPMQSGPFFQQHLTSKEIKIKPKENNVAGLQLADMLAHPLKKHTLLQKGIISKTDEDHFWKKVVEVAKPKLDCRGRDGRVDGYGLVFV